MPFDQLERPNRMAVSSANTVSEVVDCIRRDILPSIPVQIDQLTPEVVESLRGKLQALRYHCATKRIDDSVMGPLSAALSVSQGLWELLEQNDTTFVYLRRMETIRWLDLGSNGLAQYESDCTREFVVSALAASLGWISDTIWVDLARMDQQAVSRSHVARLENELWDFLRESTDSNPKGTIQDALAMQQKINLLFKTIADHNLPSGGRLLLLASMYVLLLLLNLNRIISSVGTAAS